jgi:hypothetical protein
MIDWPVEILQNKYTWWYEQIIQKAKDRNYSILKSHAKRYDGYTEVHHIIPKSFGGANSNENLVRFSAREHFICHWLLTKMTTGHHRNQMLTAFVLMSGTGSKSARYNFKITSSRVFEQIRIDYADYVSKKLTGREISQETRDKISKINTGRKFSKEVNLSKGRKGRPAPVLSPEGKARLGMWARGKTYEELYGKEQAAILKEKCKNIGEKNGFYGKTHSEETRLKFKEYYNNPAIKKLKSDAVKGDKNPAKRPEVREQISRSQKERLAKQKILGTGHYDPALLAARKELSKGSKNGNAKTFRFTDPANVVTDVTGGFKNFCKDHKLNYSGIMRKMENNSCQYKGWTIQIINKQYTKGSECH